MAAPLFFINVVLIACLTSIATDIYAPSLPAIASIMETSIVKAQFSLTAFMFGLAISLLIYGPISEGVGRRGPLITGLILFICGSFICILSPSIEMLIFGRLIQGLGAGASSSLWRSIFRDVYQGDDLAKYGSWLSIIITFFIPAVPIFGGYLQHYIGWQASFGFIILYSIITLLAVIFSFTETSQYHLRKRLNIRFISQTYAQLLSSPIFMGYTLSVFFCYGAFFSWIAVGPALLMHTLKLNPVQFGWVSFIVSSGAMALAGAVNAKVVARFGGKCMLRLGWALMFISGCLLLLAREIFGINVYAVIVPVFLFYFGTTFIWPNAFAGAFTPFGKIAGYTGSLYSFLQVAGAAIIGTFAVYLPSNSPVPLGVIFILSSLCAWLVYELLVNRFEEEKF